MATVRSSVTDRVIALEEAKDIDTTSGMLSAAYPVARQDIFLARPANLIGSPNLAHHSFFIHHFHNSDLNRHIAPPNNLLTTEFLLQFNFSFPPQALPFLCKHLCAALCPLCTQPQPLLCISSLAWAWHTLYLKCVVCISVPFLISLCESPANRKVATLLCW